MKTMEDYLRNWRVRNNFTQEMAADRLAVSQSTYHKWESGKSVVPFKYYANVANIIDVPISEFISPGVTVIVEDKLRSQKPFQLDVKDLFRLLEENNGLLRQRCERLEKEVERLKNRL